MHVALVGNTAWFDEELSLFRRLAVGLMDDGVRVTAVSPEQVAAEETGGFAPPLRWRDTPWPPFRNHRVRALAPRLAAAEVTLIHALDGPLWAGGAALAQRLNCPLVVWAWSRHDVAPAARLADRLAALRAEVVAATQPLADALRQELVPRLTVRMLAPGVHLSPTPAAQPEADSLCAAICGSPQNDAGYRALFLAIRRVVNDHPRLLFFMDAAGGGQHHIWQAARRIGLLGNISFTPHRPGHREMLLRADALIHPQPAGRARGLTLDAMARGTPVLAQADPWLDYLSDQTAWLVPDADPDAWEALLRRWVGRPDEVRELGVRAREWIGQRHLASDQVARTLEIYRDATGEAFKFPG